ncbi:alpha/beta hydrolase [Streptomyces orinoci]|uniref:Alpha/beta hydrolase n=1 Tax=Streptomyces orinoci TaxID=67339 RepID=A0ABV3JR68_STRON|nr:alpha/beta hydrolase [Streptomyces orinoci]
MLKPVSGVLAAAIATAVLCAASAHAQQTTVPARYTQQHLNWQTCDDAQSLECASMTVPRDWHHPDAGHDLTIAVSRHRAADPAKRRGVLMMAAGGPGGQGRTRPAGFVRQDPAVGAAYDVVSFDQRGVGRSSKPTCQTGPEMTEFLAHDYRDRSAAAIRRVLDNSRKMARDCAERSDGLLPYLTTEQTAHDMDLFRSLLGERKVSYYGPSYATMIGAYYASLYPQHIERAVLDSNIAFNGSWQDFETGQPASFQRRFEQDFLPWLAKYDSVYHYGRTVAAAKAKWERQRAALAEHPLTDGSVTVGPNQFDSATINAIYEAANFPALASSLSAFDHWKTATPKEKGTAEALSANYAPGFLAEYFSVTCSDTSWNRDTGYWVRRSAKDTAKLPLAGARELAFSAVCADWPAPTAPKVKVTGDGLPATLMLNSVHDPATYYEGAQRAHRALHNSRLVTVTGDGDHGQYQNGNSCVDHVVDDYLLNGKAPAHDITCQGKPLPVPTAG